MGDFLEDKWGEYYKMINILKLEKNLAILEELVELGIHPSIGFHKDVRQHLEVSKVR